MSKSTLYRGVWPQNVSKLAKYAVRFVDGQWRVTVLYDLGEGLTYLAVEGNGAELAERINDLRASLGEPPGGPFYINEYQHVIVPTAAPPELGTGSLYHAVGRFDGTLTFEYENKPLTTRPVDAYGAMLEPGAKWTGPRPGIPYVLAAGGGDVYFESPALTDAPPPEVRPRTTRKVQLSYMLKDRGALARAIRPIAMVKGHVGGRFYVNEHRAIFAPVGSGDGNGLDYVYCGQIELAAWFPEPTM